MKKLNVWQIDAAQMTPFYNLAICQGLVDADCDVRYVASRYLYTKLEYPSNITYDRHYFRGIDADWLLSYPLLRKVLRGLYYPIGNVRLRQKVKTARPDIVHFQWSRLPRFDLPLIQAIQNMAIPVIHTVHDVIPLYEKETSVSRLYDIYRQCDGLIVHSEANKQTLLSKVNDLDPHKIFVLPLVNAPFPKPTDASHQKARQALGIPQDKFVALFFGLVKHYKGIDILLDTMKLMTQYKDEMMWLVVGKAGDDEQQTYLNQIREFENAIVVSDYIANDDMWQYYMTSDVGVFPYRHIFQSAALLTAMNFDLPIIATNVGSFPETIDGNGVIVPKENPEAIRDAILDAKTTWDLDAMRQRSYEIVNTIHRPDKVGQSLRTIYERIATK